MSQAFPQVEQQGVGATVDVEALAERLDRADILLLKEFYHSGRPHPDDTVSHVLRLLVDRLKQGNGPLARLSYCAIRKRLENLVALGLVGRIRRTNPAVYYPLDLIAPQVRRIMVVFAADLVGVHKGPKGGRS